MLELIILIVMAIVGFILVTIMNYCKHDYEFKELELAKNGKNYTQVMKCRKCGHMVTTKV